MIDAKYVENNHSNGTEERPCYWIYDTDYRGVNNTSWRSKRSNMTKEECCQLCIDTVGCNFSVLAEVILTSPFCIGMSFLSALIANSFSIAEIKSVNSNRKTLTIFYELDEEKFVKILSLESGKVIKNIKLEF